ncbi:MAG: hypothetical protein L0H73_08080 [Nitrococcus sp.]|nr:hypothetical protein [Nitrococcus sp.]
MTKTLLAAIVLLALTVVHHLYGAAIYDTPWRHHVALIAIPIVLVLILAYGIHRWRPSSFLGRSFMWVFILVTLLVPVAWIGLFEGGYNHLVKNALFFAGVPRATFDRLFPPPTYELPNDFWFEVTGAVQFFIGLYVLYCLVGLWKDWRAGG